MIRSDAVIVGGGPAGSTCARTLGRAGWSVVVIDAAAFPRDKVCAGWLTPGVFPLLDLSPDEYRAAGLTLEAVTGFRTSVSGGPAIATEYGEVVSYAVRRCEFDDYLLRRSGARVIEKTPARTFERAGDGWIVNGEVSAPVVVGAGGHFCPVARYLRGSVPEEPPVVAKEAEFRLSDAAAARPMDRSPELLFCRDMQGYAWCVRKGAYLNVGIGRRDRTRFAEHVRAFVDLLIERGTLDAGAPVTWKGHAYRAAGVGTMPIVGDGMLLCGDAAGLAFPESGEGIAPAIESGLLAAQTLAAIRPDYSRERLEDYAAQIRRRHPPAHSNALTSSAAYAAVARALVRSRVFTRRVLLDRWFLRRAAA